MKGLILLALFGCAYGALYQRASEGHADLDQIHNGDNDKVHEHHDIPDESETLHEGLKGTKPKGKTSRGATVALPTSNAATQQAIVDTHNQLRASVGASDMQKLTWDTDIATKAQAWANQCVFRHPTNSDAEQTQYLGTTAFPRQNGMGGLGQNIAYMSSGGTWDYTIKNQWFGEQKDFVYDGNPSGVVGHFTQIVWAKTFKIGCGYTKCSFGDYFVCDYGGAGNVSPGQYKPYTKGAACGMCSAKCSNGLCTNPCPYRNYYSNCDQLIPTPATQCPAKAFAYDKCDATCKCKTQGLMY